MLEIIKIGESNTDENEKWYQTINGQKTQCSEDIMMYLWFKYAENKNGSYREDKDGYNIFCFTTPYKCDNLVSNSTKFDKKLNSNI